MFKFTRDLFIFVIFAQMFAKNKLPQTFYASIEANETCKINMKIYGLEMIFHRQNVEINSHKNK